jgi:hypothetical protein
LIRLHPRGRFGGEAVAPLKEPFDGWPVAATHHRIRLRQADALQHPDAILPVAQAAGAQDELGDLLFGAVQRKRLPRYHCNISK